MGEEEMAGDPYATLFLERKLQRFLGHFEREFQRPVTEPTYEMYKWEFNPRFGWGSFLSVEPCNNTHPITTWPVKTQMARKPPLVPKEAISVKDSVGGEILDSDSAPKRRKLKEQSSSINAEIFKGRDWFGCADVASRDWPADPSRQGLDVGVMNEVRKLKHRADQSHEVNWVLELDCCRSDCESNLSIIDDANGANVAPSHRQMPLPFDLNMLPFDLNEDEFDETSLNTVLCL